jgi:AraC family transcriptional regulator of adaptative response/methylated-DNA-[protein]-cysteine methyltransferase
MTLRDYERIENAITYLEEHFREQPELSDLAKHVGLSEFHLQRLFQRWAGISPKKFLQCLTIRYAKQRLRESASVLDATFDAGLSSPSRLHDLFVVLDAVTPGEYKSRGDQLEIAYGFHDTPFGEALVAVTQRGICGFEFITAGRDATVDAFKQRWDRARVASDPRATRPVVERLFAGSTPNGPQELRLLVRGTNFQIQVWQALLRIPAGAVTSYGDLARRLGHAEASRAVGNAVGKNSIAYLIPCHRVIQSTGLAHRYRWGAARKKAMLAWEASSDESESP